MKIKRLSVIFVAIALAFASLAGCTKKLDLEGKLVVGLLAAGYGQDFMDEMLQAYKAENPEVEYYIDASEDKQTKFYGELKSGPRGNAVDIYFVTDLNFNKYVDDGKVSFDGVEYDSLLENLTETFREPIGYNGETESIESKMTPVYRDFLQKNNPKSENEIYYAFPWASGPCGIIYNTEMFETNGWPVPETTDDLIDLVKRIYREKVEGKPDSEKIYPFVWAGNNGTSYWQYLEMVWQAQYDGLEGWKKFWTLQDDFGNYTADPFGSDSRLYMMEVVEEIIQPQYCVPNSDTKKTSAAQIDFLDGRAAMIVCGNWMEQEMAKNYPDITFPIAMMKTPVLSAAIEKIKTENGGVLDEEKYNEIKNIQFSLGSNHLAAIPSYADQKEVAKDFLKFIASDTGLKIFMKYAKAFLPFEQDFETSDPEFYNQLTPFLKSQLQLDKKVNYVLDETLIHPIYYKNSSLRFFPSYIYPEPFLANDSKSPEQLRLEQWNAAKSIVQGFKG